MFELLYRMQAPVWKGLSPRVVLELQTYAKSSSICILLECFSPTGVHPVNWEGGTVPLKTAALAAKERCSI